MQKYKIGDRIYFDAANIGMTGRLSGTIVDMDKEHVWIKGIYRDRRIEQFSHYLLTDKATKKIKEVV